MNEITIYSVIGPSFWEEGITDQYIKERLDGMSGDVTVRINSGGGDVFHGFAIYNLLKQYAGKVIMKIDGLAASSASVIAMAGDEIHMGEASMLMIHNPWTIALGDADEMIKTSELLDKIKGSIVGVYAANTDIENGELSEMMDKETWMTAEEAIDLGFAVKPPETETLNNSYVDKIQNTQTPWIHNAPQPQQKNDPVVVPDPVIEPENKTPLLKIAAKARLLEMA